MEVLFFFVMGIIVIWFVFKVIGHVIKGYILRLVGVGIGILLLFGVVAAICGEPSGNSGHGGWSSANITSSPSNRNDSYFLVDATRGAHLRTCGSTDCESLGVLPTGTTVYNSHSFEGDWIEVTVSSDESLSTAGIEGWIYFPLLR